MSTSYTYEKLDQEVLLQHLFHPEPSSAPMPDNCEDIMIPTEDRNGEQGSDYTDIAEQFKKILGISFLAAEYRGYGLATGTPTATSMMQDCQLILKRTLQWKEDNGYNGKLLIMGRSLGCASAIELVHTNPKQVDALLIDSGFAYTIPVLQAVGVDTEALNITESDCFNNLPKIQVLSQKPWQSKKSCKLYLVPPITRYLLIQARCTMK
jgi:hypothetical protein